MRLENTLVTGTIHGLMSLVCKIDSSQLVEVPRQGPLILACNHINFLEIPIMYARLQPRPLTAMAKSESWDNPAMAYLFNLWEAIPIRRGEADLAGLRNALAALEAGRILVVAPEGTRSNDGCLQPAHGGIVLLALYSHAPVLPLVFYGNENFHQNYRRLRRTDFNIRVGKPFHLDASGAPVNRRVREQMLDEIMAQLALLLPETHRGVYASAARLAPQYLRFI